MGFDITLTYALTHKHPHAFLELVKSNDTISVFISLLEELAPVSLEVASFKHGLEVLHRELTIFVRVHQIECFSELLLLAKNFSIHGSRDEFLKVNYSVSISVALLDHFLPISKVIKCLELL